MKSKKITVNFPPTVAFPVHFAPGETASLRLRRVRAAENNARQNLRDYACAKLAELIKQKLEQNKLQKYEK
jgi:hypothetical protein